MPNNTGPMTKDNMVELKPCPFCAASTAADDDITIPEYCPILQVKLGEVHNGKDRENSPCLDRIDNAKGYVKGNIAVISFKANRLKSNLSIEILERLMKYVSSA